MLRFRNPGTQFSTQVQVIKQLYASLRDQDYFTLNDMAIVIAQGHLMTAYGYAGKDALRLSNTDQDSMNSALMNAKMYAEVFRMLGWVTPYNEKSSYPLVFSYIGIHIALSEGDCSRLYEQCVLGINNPTQLADRMSYDEKIRFFKCALRTFIDLDGIMYKHELCLGPMCINDEEEGAYQNMLKMIKTTRGDYLRLQTAFLNLANSLGMRPTPVDNCTRLPVGFMKSCNWVKKVINKSLYGRSMVCLEITQHGIDTYKSIKDMFDLRLDQFNRFDKSTQMSMIRLGVYAMLSRSGYDMSSVEGRTADDLRTCKDILEGRDILFSPYQTVRRNIIEEALCITLPQSSNSSQSVEMFESTVDEREAHLSTEVWHLNIPDGAATELLREKEDVDFINKVNELKSCEYSSAEIVSQLFDYYKNATQNTFYPLIATLFKVMGFRCIFSRPGDNGARWDAIIVDKSRSIPIEIKSPTEEQHLSIKAIRQALENKIILLSRKTYETTPEITTLAIGYYMPNKRAEVNRLIADFKKTYGYRIGVIDLKSLLSLAISILIDKRGFEKEKLYLLEGLMNANI